MREPGAVADTSAAGNISCAMTMTTATTTTVCDLVTLINADLAMDLTDVLSFSKLQEAQCLCWTLGGAEKPGESGVRATPAADAADGVGASAVAALAEAPAVIGLAAAVFDVSGLGGAAELVGIAVRVDVMAIAVGMAVRVARLGEGAAAIALAAELILAVSPAARR